MEWSTRPTNRQCCHKETASRLWSSIKCIYYKTNTLNILLYKLYKFIFILKFLYVTGKENTIVMINHAWLIWTDTTRKHVSWCYHLYICISWPMWLLPSSLFDIYWCKPHCLCIAYKLLVIMKWLQLKSILLFHISTSPVHLFSNVLGTILYHTKAISGRVRPTQPHSYI